MARSSALVLGLLRTVQCLSVRGGAKRGVAAAAAAAFGGGDARPPHRVVFLGSPSVAALTLEALLDAAAQGRGGGFEVVAAVSQPPAKSGRKKALRRSAAHAVADARGVPCLTPASARDPAFLDALRALAPDLCVTAAYGQFLPDAFLNIPARGTLNIHPSLLPRWRGAAPVQRALEAGDAHVGVTVLETVSKMDAGPVAAASAPRAVDDGDAAPALLDELFALGAAMLVDDVMPALWAGTLALRAQDDAAATAAPKLAKADAVLDVFRAPADGRDAATAARDKVRAFDPWPGTVLPVAIGGGPPENLKVLAARVADAATAAPGNVALAEPRRDALAVACADGSTLELLRVQAPNRKPVDAAAFWNGLRGATCECAPPAPDPE